MRCAKAKDRAHHDHPLMQCQGLACQRPAPARQRREALPKRRVEPLHVRRIDHPVPLRPAAERLHTCRCAIDHTTFGLDHPPPLVALEDLRDQDMPPRPPPWPPTRPCARDHDRSPAWPGWRTPRHRDSPAGRRAAQRLTRAVSRRIKGTSRCSLTSPPSHKRVVTSMASAIHTIPPCFLTRKLIGLDLSEVTRLLNQIRVPDLALTARPGPPICAGALVEAKRGHDRLHGTPMGEHGHDEDDSLCGGAQLIEDRA